MSKLLGTVSVTNRELLKNPNWHELLNYSLPCIERTAQRTASRYVLGDFKMLDSIVSLFS